MEIFYYVLTGISFGLVCVCTFFGIFRPVVAGIHLLLWSFNGFLFGRNYEMQRQNEMLDAAIRSYSNLAETNMLINEINKKLRNNISNNEREESDRDE